MSNWSINIFRLCGDLLHLASFVILFLKIWSLRSCAGISLKTQYLYAIVFVCRYLDLFWNWISLYLIVMKLVFLGSTFGIIYMMLSPYRKTYNAAEDKFPLWYLIIPCALLALVVNHKFTFWEVLWTFSIYLEAVAILPQLLLLQYTGDVDAITYDYIFCLGAYRALYLLNWIYRALTEEGYRQWIVWISGLIQTALYSDFLYYYLKSKWYGVKMKLPL
jgi:ER lumen protein retaining receptor